MREAEIYMFAPKLPHLGLLFYSRLRQGAVGETDVGGNVVFVGNIYGQDSLESVISCSQFSSNESAMPAYQHFLPASLRLSIRIGVGLYVLFIIWQSLTPAGTGGGIPHLDKLLHALVYGILAGGLCIAWPKLSKAVILLGCIALGGVLEIAQGAMPLGRTASLWDGLANMVGAVLAIALITILARKFAK